MDVMKELAFRLHHGDDLKVEIEKACSNIDTAVVLSAVGCVYEANFRLAKAVNTMHNKCDYEIVSLMGTVSKGNAHLHISLSDEHGKVIGGHLLEGCFIDTTCELVLGVLEEYSSDRPFDKQTGWDEIEFRRMK